MSVDSVWESSGEVSHTSVILVFNHSSSGLLSRIWHTSGNSCHLELHTSTHQSQLVHSTQSLMRVDGHMTRPRCELLYFQHPEDELKLDQPSELSPVVSLQMVGDIISLCLHYSSQTLKLQSLSCCSALTASFKQSV